MRSRPQRKRQSVARVVVVLWDDSKTSHTCRRGPHRGYDFDHLRSWGTILAYHRGEKRDLIITPSALGAEHAQQEQKPRGFTVELGTKSYEHPISFG